VIDKLIRAGTQRHILSVARGLKSHGIDSEIVCLQYEGPLAEQAREAGIEVTSLHLKRIYDPKAIATLLPTTRLLKRKRFDAALVYLFAAHIYGTIAARLAGIPVVISCRRQCGFWLKRRYIAARHLANSFVTRTVANSEPVACFVCGTEGLPLDTIEIIPNGVDMERFIPGRDAASRRWRNRCDAGEADCVVGIVASLKPVKRHDLFLRAAALAAREIAEVRFLIVGEGPLRQEYERLAHELGIDNRVTFAGGVDDVAPALRAMDVFVLASDSEGMSNALLEAMSTGLACAASEVGGNREIIEEDVTGRLFAAGDGDELARIIIGLAGDKHTRRRLGEAARAKVVEEYSQDLMLQRIATLIRNTVCTD
jgi:glycosyltransferase involved in cell wall biosynthesis